MGVCDLSNGGAALDGLHGLEVLLAGPPCQGFSTAGKRGLDDPRNHLLVRAGEIALALAPSVFVVENVTGVVKGKHAKYWWALHGMLESGGYRTTDIKCDVTSLGLAQMRTRMVMIAWNSDRDLRPVLVERPGSTLRQALNGLPPDAANHAPVALRPGSDQARIARCIAPGQKLCNVRGGPRSVHTWNIPEVYGAVTEREKQVLTALLRLRRRLRIREFGDADPVSARALAAHLGRVVATDIKSLLAKGYVRRIDGRYDLRHTFNGKSRRLHWDAPSYTVDTRFTDPRYFLHPEQDRGFSVREAARLQGFPDTFCFDDGKKQQASMVGNAVPPPLGHALALLIREQLFQ